MPKKTSKTKTCAPKDVECHHSAALQMPEWSDFESHGHEPHNAPMHLVPVRQRIPFYVGMFFGALVVQVVVLSMLTVVIG